MIEGGKVGLLVGISTFGAALGPEIAKRTSEKVGGWAAAITERAMGDGHEEIEEWIVERQSCLAVKETTQRVPILKTGTPLDGSEFEMPICQLHSFADELRGAAEQKHLGTLTEEQRKQYLQAKTLQRPMLRLHRSDMTAEQAFRIFHVHDKRIDALTAEMVSERVKRIAVREASLTSLDLELSGQGQEADWLEPPHWWVEAGLGAQVRPVLAKPESLLDQQPVASTPDLLPDLHPGVTSKQVEKSLTIE